MRKKSCWVLCTKHSQESDIKTFHKNKTNNFLFLHSIKMTKITLKFDNIRVNKKKIVKKVSKKVNLIIMKITFKILLVTKKVKLLDNYVLFYIKWLGM